MISILRAVAPKGSGSMRHGIPTRDFAPRIAAFNARKSCLYFYVDPEIVRRNCVESRGLDWGKGCIRSRTIGGAPLDT
jgi:hypothetical protein